MANEPLPAELDHELTRWLDASNDETREIIIEARLPFRRVQLDPQSTDGLRMQEVTTQDGPSRADVLRQLQEELSKFIDRPMRVLSAAGAIALVTTPNQLRQIVTNPLVKAVRVNRRLK